MGRLTHRRIASKPCIPDDGFDKILRQQCRDGTAKLAAALLDAGYLAPAISAPVEVDCRVPSQPEGEPLPEPLSSFTKQLINTIATGYVPRPIRVFVSDISRAVCKHYGITKTELFSRRRNRKLARARQVVMYLSRELTALSLPEIGRRMGGFDHTTIIHGIKKIEELSAIDDEISADVRSIRACVRAA